MTLASPSSLEDGILQFMYRKKYALLQLNSRFVQKLRGKKPQVVCSTHNIMQGNLPFSIEANVVVTILISLLLNCSLH